MYNEQNREMEVINVTELHVDVKDAIHSGFSSHTEVILNIRTRYCTHAC